MVVVLKVAWPMCKFMHIDKACLSFLFFAAAAEK
jgi:hypothetical protein